MMRLVVCIEKTRDGSKYEQHNVLAKDVIRREALKKTMQVL